MIIKCKKRLEEKDFDPRSIVPCTLRCLTWLLTWQLAFTVVSFQISQIGADDGADKFLRGLQNNPDIKNYIHITAGRFGTALLATPSNKVAQNRQT